MAAYEDIENKLLTRETARGYLNAIELYEKRWVAFQSEVPAGTIVTIIGVVPKVWYFPFSSDRYLVRLNPDLSRGLDVELELDRGLEGSLDGLNPEFFIREKPTQGPEHGPHVDDPGLL